MDLSLVYSPPDSEWQTGTAMPSSPAAVVTEIVVAIEPHAAIAGIRAM